MITDDAAASAVPVDREATPATRRRRKAPAERAAEIRAAAVRVALAEGLSGVTLRAVAAEADVTSALVAHYEPSAPELVAKTFDTLAGAELAEVGRLVAGPPSHASARLGLLVDTLLDPARRDISALWADAWSVGRRSEAVAAAARARMNDWQELAAGIIREARASGEISADPDRAAALLFALIDSTTAYALVGYGSPGDHADLVRSTFQAALTRPDGLG